MRSIIIFLRQDRRNRDARRDAPSAREASTVISSHRREQPPEERIRSVNPSRRVCGCIPMGGLSTRVQLHFIPRRRSAGSPHLPLYHLVSPWAARAIDLLEVEGTRRRTLPARSSRYACVPRVYGFVLASLSRTVPFCYDGAVKSAFEPAVRPRVRPRNVGDSRRSLRKTCRKARRSDLES